MSEGPPALAVVVAWTALDLLFNVRYPAREPAGWETVYGAYDACLPRDDSENERRGS